MNRWMGAFALVAALLMAGPESVSADGYVGAKKPAHHAGGCSWGGRFSGFYVGANVGYARHQADTLEREILGLSVFNDSEDGFVAGAQVGYNWQCGAMLFGIEADWNWADLERQRTYDILGLVPLFENRRSVDWYGTLRTKSGIIVQDTLLLYVTGGLAFANITNRLDIPLANINVFDRDDVRWGWTAGFGTEWAINDRISLKSEVLYMQFEDSNHSVPIIGPIAIDFTDRDSMWVSRIGLNFKFHRDAHYEALK